MSALVSISGFLSWAASALVSVSVFLPSSAAYVFLSEFFFSFSFSSLVVSAFVSDIAHIIGMSKEGATFGVEWLSTLVVWFVVFSRLCVSACSASLESVWDAGGIGCEVGGEVAIGDTNWGWGSALATGWAGEAAGGGAQGQGIWGCGCNGEVKGWNSGRLAGIAGWGGAGGRWGAGAGLAQNRKRKGDDLAACSAMTRNEVVLQ